MIIDPRIKAGCKVINHCSSIRRLRSRIPFVVEKIYKDKYGLPTAILKNREEDFRHGYFSHTVSLVEVLEYYEDEKKGDNLIIINDVADVLANSRIEGNKLYLPEGQLDRALYVSVNKVLTTIKGKWNRSAKAHIFPENPEEVIENILLTGEYEDEKKTFQIFETPIPIAENIVRMADIKKGETILEPSAGRGRIAGLIENCDCIELNPGNAAYLKENGFNLIHDNFMTFDKEYDVILGNPPFTKQQDIDHVNKMMDLARRRVVSVMSSSVLFRSNKKAVEFRERIKSLNGVFEELPEGAFTESGTKVKTCIVKVDL